MTLVQSLAETSCMSKYYHPVLRSPPVSLKSSQVRVSGNGCTSVGLVVEDGFCQVLGSSFCFSHFLEENHLCSGGLGQISIILSCDSEGSWNTLGLASPIFYSVPDLSAVSGVCDLMWSSCSLRWLTWWCSSWGL